MPERDLKRRFTEFGIRAAQFARTLPDDEVGYSVKRQLVRSAMSIGANYREACNARTKTEFTSKLQIALQEADESEHWLESIIGTMPPFARDAKDLLDELGEIIAILAASIRTAKSRPDFR
jgi:four helix bundle protein